MSRVAHHVYRFTYRYICLTTALSIIHHGLILIAYIPHAPFLISYVSLVVISYFLSYSLLIHLLSAMSYRFTLLSIVLLVDVPRILTLSYLLLFVYKPGTLHPGDLSFDLLFLGLQS